MTKAKPAARHVGVAVPVEEKPEMTPLLDGNNVTYMVPVHQVGDAWEADIERMGLCLADADHLERERLVVAVAQLPDGTRHRLVIP